MLIRIGTLVPVHLIDVDLENLWVQIVGRYQVVESDTIVIDLTGTFMLERLPPS